MPGRDRRSPWVWYGGRPSLDLVNTRRDRQGDGVEYLDTATALADWLTAAGTPAARLGDVDDALLADAITLREAIDACVTAAIARRRPPAAAIATLNDWLADTAPMTLRVSGRVAVLSTDERPESARRALQLVAVDAAHLLGTADRALARICPGPHCGGRFLDNSPAGRRRWCRMSVCGNRAKAARHRVSAGL
jgi:predicted RNA-binding Zn ribbon-like protein